METSQIDAIATQINEGRPYSGWRPRDRILFAMAVFPTAPSLIRECEASGKKKKWTREERLALNLLRRTTRPGRFSSAPVSVKSVAERYYLSLGRADGGQPLEKEAELIRRLLVSRIKSWSFNPE